MARACSLILPNALLCSCASNGPPVSNLSIANDDSAAMRDVRAICNEPYVGYLLKMNDYNIYRKE